MLPHDMKYVVEHTGANGELMYGNGTLCKSPSLWPLIRTMTHLTVTSGDDQSMVFEILEHL